MYISGGLPLNQAKVNDWAKKTGTLVNRKQDMISPFVVDCYRFGFAEERHGPVQERFVIPYFHDEWQLTSLRIRPLRVDPVGDELRERLVERGGKFIDLVNDGKRFALFPSHPT